MAAPYTRRTDISTLASDVDKVFASLPSEGVLQHNARQQSMIRKVLELYICAFNHLNKDYLVKHILGVKPDGSPLYIQHSPSVADGVDSIFDFGELASKKAAELWGRPQERPVPEFDFKRIFVDGQYVICHLLATRYPGDLGWVCADFFRLAEDANGDFRVVEHWESICDVVPSEKLQHSNTQF